MKYTSRITFYIMALSMSMMISCRKGLEIPLPVSSVLTPQVFSSDDIATSAADNMYFQMVNTTQGFANYGISIFTGMSADELIPFDNSDYYLSELQTNTLTSTNPIIGSDLWNDPYSVIYSANAILEGLTNYAGVHDSVKNELIGEAEFVRAFCDFYLVNLYGDIPLVTTINWHHTNLLPRTPSTQVYQSIIQDLQDAQKKLSVDFSVGHGQRIIPNKWAATALLARVFLYIGDWKDAEEQASQVIDNSILFSLVQDLNSVFLINSTEAIWQLQQSNESYTFNATPDGYLLIPRDSTYNPYAYLTTELLDSFETGDQRLQDWVDSTPYNGVNYYVPYKYKMGPGQTSPGGPYTEYSMVLRLAEQYLIRAEARAQQNNTQDAIPDLNKIRSRAGLAPTSATSQSDLLSAIAHERQVELFCEWGHRWLDLKRTGMAANVLAKIKPKWNSHALLYPIPVTELIADPNLTQNPGY